MIGSSKTTFGFDPRTIPGCQLWLDGADSSTITGTTSVTAWADKSGLGNNATTYSGTISYSTSLNALLFSDSGMQTSIVTPTNRVGSGFFVVRVTNPSPAGSFGVFQGSAGNGGRQFRNDGGTTLRTVKQNLLDMFFSGTTVVNNLMIAGYVDDGTNLTHSVNGTLYTTTNTTTFESGTIIQIGKSYNGEYLIGNIHEVVLFSTALTTTQRQQVEGYLAHKWGLTGYYFPTSPLTIPGLALWLDAADSSTITLSSSKVTQWNDKSGNGYNFTQATSGNQPTYSTASLNTSNTITFTSANSTFLTGTASTTFMGTNSLSVYGVFKTNNNTSSSSVFAKSLAGGAAGRILYAVRDGGNPGYINSGIGTTGQNAYANTLSDTYTVGAWRVHGFVSDRSGWTTTLFQNGSLIATTTITADTTTNLTNAYPMIIGGYNTSSGSVSPPLAGYYLDGAIAEIIVFSTVLTTTQRQTIETYLAKKWGFTSMYPAIPSTHPFYSVRPYLRAFNPTDISGCRLWLDAADQTSITLSGSSVTQWSDKSGTGNNATANTGTVTTNSTRINGLNTIRFNTSSFLNISSFVMTSNFSVFAVLRGVSAQGSGNAGYFFLGNGTQPSFFVYTLQPQYGNISGPYSAWVASTGETNWYMPSSDFFLDKPGFIYTDNNSSFVNGSQLTFNPNRAAVPNTITAGTYSIQVGGRVQADSLAFDFAECIFYNRTITTTERQQVEGYLAHKWGLNLTYGTNTPLTIPGCHLWLDASDTTTISPSAGGTLTSWTDKSGTGKTITINSAPSYSTSGFNGSYPCMTFTSGNNLRITIPSVGTGDIAVFAVWKQTTANTQHNVFSIGTPGGGTETALGWNNGEGRYKFYRYAGPESVNPAATNNANVIGSALQVSGLRTLHINGVAPSGTGTESYNQTNTTAFIGGGTFPLVGQLAELIFYIGTVTTAQRQTIEGYLARKWGLTISNQFLLTHPFNRIPPASVVFSPLNISGVSLWLDAADTSSMTLSGSSVTAWKDKSGNGYVMTNNQGTTSISTSSLNSLNTVYTPSGTNSKITNFVGRTKCTMFLVGKAAISRYLLALNGGFLYTGNDSLLYFQPPTGTYLDLVDSVSGVVVSNNTWFILCIGYDNATNNTANPYTINGTTRTTTITPRGTPGILTDQNITSTLYINSANGTNSYDSVYTAEILYYNNTLTTSQRQQVEGYLAQKWGLTGLLPSTHPFKKIPA